MIITLQLIPCVCVLLSVISFIKITKEDHIIPLINIGGHLLIIGLVWVAEFYYVDELNLSGSTLTSILFVVQVILFVVATMKPALKFRRKA